MKIFCMKSTSKLKDTSLAYFLRFYVGLYILLSFCAFNRVIAQHSSLETMSIGPQSMPQNLLLHLLDKKEFGIDSSSDSKSSENKLDRSILMAKFFHKTENKNFQNFKLLKEKKFTEFSLNSGSNLKNSKNNINFILNNLDYGEEILQSKQSNRNTTNFWNNESKNSHKSHYKSSPIGNLSNINMNISTNYLKYSSKMTEKEEDKNRKFDLYSNTTQYMNMSVNDVMNGRSRKLPGAIIIGVKKGGTRALLEFLGAHPQVVTSGPEVHFFDQHYHLGLEWYRNKMPLSSDHQLTMEKTPSYFISTDVPERIYNMSPDTRLILLLRDPVIRAMSDYAQAICKRPSLPPFEGLVFRNKTRTRRHSSRSTHQNQHEGFHKHDDLNKIIRKYNLHSSFNTTARFSVDEENKQNLAGKNYTKEDIRNINDIIEKKTVREYGNSEINERWGAIRIGRYADHLKRWLKYFPLKNIQIIQSELLITDPLSQMKKLENFLGLEAFFSHKMFRIRSDRGFPCLVRENKSKYESKTNKTGTGIRCLGRTKGRRHPNVNEFVLEKLREYFSPKNRQLYELINRDLGWT